MIPLIRLKKTLGYTLFISSLFLFTACENKIYNNIPKIDATFSNISILEDNGTSSYDVNISDLDGDSLTLSIESNNTNILTVNKNFTNPLLQADYKNKTLDFNLTTVQDAYGMVKITLSLSDDEDNTSKSFDVNVTDTIDIFKSGESWKGNVYKTVTSPHTSKVWLDRDLGASQACTLSRDDNASGTNTFADDTAYVNSQKNCFGDYYQWGRNADGHEKASSATSVTLSSSLTSAGTSFIITNSEPKDWTTLDSNGSIRTSNWSKTDGTSICPIGFRVPTSVELTADTIDLTGVNEVQNRDDSFNSFLKLASSGYRDYDGSGMTEVGSASEVWASSISSDPSNTEDSYNIYMTVSNAYLSDDNRAYGIPVRCIKD